MQRLEIEGKFFRAGERRLLLRAVTYGPFPAGSGHVPGRDFTQIAEAGFNAVRVYDLPDEALLAEAEKCGLYVLAGMAWAQGCDFFTNRHFLDEAQKKLIRWLKKNGGHVALGAVFVGNEIPSDMVRWMGPVAVRGVLDALIVLGKKAAPKVLFAYANFPTTEYLEPQRADFTAFNLYLEDGEKLAAYLARLHHVAGDRPVMVTEFGLDTQDHGEEAQAALLRDYLRVARETAMAGVTVYAWSDEWFNNGEVVADWSFGLIRRDGSEKPALAVLRELLPKWDAFPAAGQPMISVIVCTRNGAQRMRTCLHALLAVNYENFEVIVVDDGSTDGTAIEVAKFPQVRLVIQKAAGLSAARNAGARAAKGEIFAYTDDDCEVDEDWLRWLAWTFGNGDWAAVGGPNLPPAAVDATMAVVICAPGAPTHVMLNDVEAEHLPGCHLAVRREFFEKIAGFDPIFETAGDDVDFCWRLQQAGDRLGFSAGSFVWHHRRTSIGRYLKQQRGYGRAEALLFRKHPERFSRGGIRWEGFVYVGSAIGVETGDVIYHGILGDEPYQMLQLHRQPRRLLPLEYDDAETRRTLRWVSWAQRHLRAWVRWWHGGPKRRRIAKRHFYRDDLHEELEMVLLGETGQGRVDLYQFLLEKSWVPCGDQDWDLQKSGVRILAATEQNAKAQQRTFLRASFPPFEEGVVRRRLDRLVEKAGFLPCERAR